MHTRSMRRAQRGVSLLEVLIAMLILAVGALGFAGLQMKALHTSADANYRAQATLLAQSAIERIQANPTQRAAIHDEDMTQLTQIAAASLPNGQIQSGDCPFNSMSCVTVSWGEQEIGSCAGGSGIDNQQASCLVMEFAR